MYLPLFEDFDDAGTFAWGAAALAFLYRALGNASVRSQSTICGCLTLLQVLSAFHFLFPQTCFLFFFCFVSCVLCSVGVTIT